VGWSANGDSLEELAALGVRTIVGFGVAGSLVDDLPKGTQIVAVSGLVKLRATPL
jgi:uridine phosphorylase